MLKPATLLSSARTAEQSSRLEHASDHPIDPQLPAGWAGSSDAQNATAISGQVYDCGPGAAGGSGSRASTAERTSHAQNPATGVAGVRPAAVCRAGGDFRVSSIQPASQ